MKKQHIGCLKGVYVKRRQCIKATTKILVYWQQNYFGKKATNRSLVYRQQKILVKENY